MELVEAAGLVEGVGRDRVGHFIAVQVRKSTGVVAWLASILTRLDGVTARRRSRHHRGGSGRSLLDSRRGSDQLGCKKRTSDKNCDGDRPRRAFGQIHQRPHYW